MGSDYTLLLHYITIYHYILLYITTYITIYYYGPPRKNTVREITYMVRRIQD